MNIDLDKFILRSKFLRFFYGIFVACLLSLLLIAPGYIFTNSAVQAYLFSVYLFLPLTVGVTSAFIFGYYEDKPSTSLINALYAVLCLIFVFITLVFLVQINHYAAGLLVIYSPVSIFMTVVGTVLSDKIVTRSNSR